MTEEEKTENVEQQPEDDPINLIDAANAAAERLEKGNAELARLIEMQQKTIIENTLSGKTTAGEKSETEEEIAEKNAREMLKGTGFEDELFPNKN